MEDCAMARKMILQARGDQIAETTHYLISWLLSLFFSPWGDLLARDDTPVDVSL